ncbi:hypothetical protein ABZ471_35650 [Streptomyces sp. NPDC005728]|uniref:hypothetical protein n=1 Tax=Streptomyces sp. NPDC005728 TaxID=3157054 RepID=UPI0033CDE96D
MTISSSPRPDDCAVISAAPAPTGAAPASPDPECRPEPPPQESLGAPHEEELYDDLLHGLVHTAVADRPLDDVVRLIGLLESTPDHARTRDDALRAAGVDRSVEDVALLVTLLTGASRDAGSADEAIRAAAESRPLEDVTRLVELLHRTPAGPHCGRAAAEAMAVGRPVEELADLIARLAADRTATETAPPEPTVPEPLDVPPVPVVPPLAYTPPAPVVPVSDLGRPRLVQTGDRIPGGGSPNAPAWLARAAALLVLLCGVAHTPRYWTSLSPPVLQATFLAAVLCVVLALALPERAVPARLAAAAVTLVVTAALAAGHVLVGRFGLPDPAGLQAATLAPPWLAGTAAAAAALAALAVLLATLGAVLARITDGR